MEITETKVTPSYILVRFDPRTEDYHKTIRAMEWWCYQTQCGKRVNMTSFAFKTEAELMLFKLKWG